MYYLFLYHLLNKLSYVSYDNILLYNILLRCREMSWREWHVDIGNVVIDACLHGLAHTLTSFLPCNTTKCVIGKMYIIFMYIHVRAFSWYRELREREREREERERAREREREERESNIIKCIWKGPYTGNKVFVQCTYCTIIFP
jgi:hypothetical protein